MQEALKNIKDMCLRYPTQEKILIIPSFRMKGQIINYLNDSGINAVNLHVMSPGSIALEWAEPEVISKGKQILTQNDMTDIIGEITTKLQQKNALAFFGNSAMTPGLARAISSGIMTLKRAGITRGNIGLESIENEQKKNDLIQILNSYEAFLIEHNYVDHADLIDIATGRIKSGKIISKACYLMPNVKLSWSEHEMIHLLCPDITSGSVETPIEGKQESGEGATTSAATNFGCNAKGIEFVRAYGEYNEIKEVVRRIILNKLPLDRTVIAVSAAEPYTQLLYQLFQQYLRGHNSDGVCSELPITFGTGLPITFSNPGKLTLALLIWIRNGFKAHDLISIFASGAISLKVGSDTDSPQVDEQASLADEAEPEESEESAEQFISRQMIISVIKESNLQWQRRTYRPTFENYRKYLNRRIADKEASGEPAETYKRKLAALDWLEDLLENTMFSNIPDEDVSGLIDADHLYKGIGRIVEKCKSISGKLDSGAYSAVLSELKGSLKSEKIPVSEAVDIMLDRIRQIRTFVESPKPGKLHITSYRAAGWLNRENVFVVGLDSGRFPGLAVEDPILLDEERLAISDQWLKTSGQNIEDNINAMKDFLASVSGRLALSYSYFDTLENRGKYPATIYNQLLEIETERQKSADAGVNGKSYEPLEKTVEFVIPATDEAIDENDCWIYCGIREGAQGDAWILDQMKKIHPDLCDIWSASDRTQVGAGRLTVDDPERIDPRENGKIQSASSLANYLECRYKYFLKHILQLKEFQQKELDTVGWLDPLQNGSLYHEIFEQFHNQTIEDPAILTNEDRASALIEKLAVEIISRYEKELPTASAYYTEKTKRDILEDCMVFAAEEVRNAGTAKPLLTEYRFGFDGDLAIDLGNEKSIKVMGAVDRVDWLAGEDSLRIIDYKTGSTSRYEILEDEQAEALNEKTLQPALYFIAMKELAGKDSSLLGFDRVKEAVYHFISKKGNYEKRTVVFDSGSEQKYKDGLNQLLDQMAAGDFTQTGFGEKGVLDEDFGICKYCGYLEICRQSQQAAEGNGGNGEEAES